MKISEYSIYPRWNSDKKLYERTNIDDAVIDDIVYSNVVDSGNSTLYGVLFGSSRKIEAVSRVRKTYELYKSGRIKKIVISGSNNGISSKKNNQSPIDMNRESIELDDKYDDDLSESYRMELMLLDMGVSSEDIIIDKESNNTIESLKRLESLIGRQDSLILISSQYHLKRCLACALKYYSSDTRYDLVYADTGYFERDNYQKTDIGNNIIYFEAMHLIKQARDKIIFDIDNGNVSTKILEKRKV